MFFVFTSCLSTRKKWSTMFLNQKSTMKDSRKWSCFTFTLRIFLNSFYYRCFIILSSLVWSCTSRSIRRFLSEFSTKQLASRSLTKSISMSITMIKLLNRDQCSRSARAISWMHWTDCAKELVRSTEHGWVRKVRWTQARITRHAKCAKFSACAGLPKLSARTWSRNVQFSQGLIKMAHESHGM